jgi:hypothetical protein
MNISRLTLINAEFNQWNGFNFSLGGVELNFGNKTFEGDLLSLSFSRDHFIIGLCFFDIIISKPIH